MSAKTRSQRRSPPAIEQRSKPCGFAHARILAFHERQKPRDERFTDALGVELGWRFTAIEAVGLYVPGGTASYPSSVLMNAVPAKVAGVARIVMVVPAPQGRINPLVLAAAHLAGIDEIYRIGGAQAIAALAYGTETIAPVAKIVGPGNAYVAAAKRRVFGTVGIDMIAGPSEVLVLADATANADWIAADLLAQAEHDAAAQSILDDRQRRARRCRRKEPGEPARDLAAPCHSRRELARFRRHHHRPSVSKTRWRSSTGWRPNISRSWPRRPRRWLPRIRNAGAIFIGGHTPEAIGDYVGGSNHVLPTARSARFSSGLGVLDFMKRTSLLEMHGARACVRSVPQPSRSARPRDLTRTRVPSRSGSISAEP